MADTDSNVDIESVLKERRKFPPSAEFSRRAQIKSFAEYEANTDRVIPVVVLEDAA